MKRIIICVMFATGLLVQSVLTAAPVYGQKKSDNLLEQRLDLHFKNQTFLGVLGILADERIPIGLEVALDHNDEYHLNMDVENATLQDVLGEIIQQEPEYRWELRDGVINIIPVRARDAFVEKFLSTSIRQFTMPKVIGKFKIRDAIVALPEVVALLKANGITASHYGYYYRPSIYTNENIDLSISNTDVRGVLNKVARDSEHNMWMVSRSGDNRTSLDVGF